MQQPRGWTRPPSRRHQARPGVLHHAAPHKGVHVRRLRVLFTASVSAPSAALPPPSLRPAASARPASPRRCALLPRLLQRPTAARVSRAERGARQQARTSARPPWRPDLFRLPGARCGAQSRSQRAARARRPPTSAAAPPLGAREGGASLQAPQTRRAGRCRTWQTRWVDLVPLPRQQAGWTALGARRHRQQQQETPWPLASPSAGRGVRRETPPPLAPRPPCAQQQAGRGRSGSEWCRTTPRR